MSKTFLDKAYGLDGAKETRALYDQWASTYEEEVAENGYATPGRVAEALRSCLPDHHAPILDYGCGTGLSGLALRAAGFDTIDGADPSPEMLDGARAKNIYRTLYPIDIESDNPVPTQPYRAIAAIGVIGSGAAPVACFDLLMTALPAKGLLAFSFNDHTLADPTYEAKLNEWLDCGGASLLFQDYGPHLPGLDMKSSVYVVEKR
ncbi:class I SAM-dependent DNA methyltransferase [Primorskyibacter sp. S87]|uniref:class I SAM-dependent DNA methyltransferase n=1 Tax=Primorskyibacter sp. S87 TaxID=3415126 RepID=UPI003C7DEB30